MPDFWQFPTVSMGLGPLMAIYQARFLKYLNARGLADTANRHVWAFLGDGEMDEPESLGAISLASREKLDNLIFVVNCNLQRLDGPVRGNGKIIQELEGNFRGAGWNVIKVVWGSGWDPLLAADKSGLLLKRMEECVDGEYQDFKSKNGAYVREHFFGKYPELLDLVKDMTDDQIWALSRGGHDPSKVYAAYKAAVDHVGHADRHPGQDGQGLRDGRGRRGPQHQPPAEEDGRERAPRVPRPVRDRGPARREGRRGAVPDDQGGQPRAGLPARSGARLSVARCRAGGRSRPRPCRFRSCRRSTRSSSRPAERTISTTMAFVRILTTLLRDKKIGKRVVPIVPDESRTFGMEGLFRQFGIWSQVGQLYRPEDANQLMYYKEDKSGQMLQEGINEAGAMSSWIAAATSYSVSDTPMIPFYVYYSMFGFQRIGDLAWAAGDSRARGFLMGGTAGRTTLNGEGLQHEDGHSHLISATIPNCISYDPTYAHEVAVIVQDGLRRMFAEQEDVFYYLTIMNENYEHPGLPEDRRDEVIEGIKRGMYLLHSTR